MADTPGILGNRGCALLMLKRYSEAAVDCRNAVLLDPTYTSAYVSAGTQHRGSCIHKYMHVFIHVCISAQIVVFTKRNRCPHMLREGEMFPGHLTDKGHQTDNRHKTTTEVRRTTDIRRPNQPAPKACMLTMVPRVTCTPYLGLFPGPRVSHNQLCRFSFYTFAYVYTQRHLGIAYGYTCQGCCGT
jgi:hypothetical protein